MARTKDHLIYLSGSGGGAGGGTGVNDPAGGGDPVKGGDPAGGGDPKAGEWFGALPEDVQKDETLSEFKDKPVVEVVTRYRDLSKKVAESSPPDKAEKYVFSLPDDMKDVPIDEAALKEIRAEALAEGLSPKGFQLRMEHQAKRYRAALESDRKEVEEAEKALKNNWGEDYDENVALVERAVKSLPEPLQKAIERLGVGSHPQFIELMYIVGEAKSEGRLRKGESGTGKKPLEDRLYGGGQQKA